MDRAQQFLTQALHIDLADYAFLPEEATSVARPNRTDWTFTWERKTSALRKRRIGCKSGSRAINPEPTSNF